MTLSLLLHALALVLTQLYLQQHDKPQPTPSTLSVRLVSAPPIKPRALPVKKLLTTPSPAPVTVTQTPQQPPAPITENISEMSGETITGITMPGAVPNPFSGLDAKSTAFIRNKSVQENAVHAYQEHMRARQAQQQSENEAYFVTLQLQQMLVAIFSETSIEGKCVLNTENSKFACSTAELAKRIAMHEKPVTDLYKRLHALGKRFNGFNVIKADNKVNTILIN